MEKKIEVCITNQDYAENVVSFLSVNENPLYHALKRALSDHQITVDVVRFGTFNVNVGDAQIGVFDASFDNDDYQRLLNQFLKGIQFKEKRVLTLFERPRVFNYPGYWILEDVANDHVELPQEVAEVDNGLEAALKN
jgi:hypothetical protein